MIRETFTCNNNIIKIFFVANRVASVILTFPSFYLPNHYIVFLRRVNPNCIKTFLEHRTDDLDSYTFHRNCLCRFFRPSRRRFRACADRVPDFRVQSVHTGYLIKWRMLNSNTNPSPDSPGNRLFDSRPYNREFQEDLIISWQKCPNHEPYRKDTVGVIGKS